MKKLGGKKLLILISLAVAVIFTACGQKDVQDAQQPKAETEKKAEITNTNVSLNDIIIDSNVLERVKKDGADELFANEFADEDASSAISDIPYQAGEKTCSVIPNMYVDGVINVNYKKSYLLDKDGKIISKAYKNVYPLIEGRALFKDENGNYGFLDKTGKEVVKPEYQLAMSYSNGMALVAKVDGDKKTVFFIDLDGKQLPVKYEGFIASPFNEGTAKIQRNNDAEVTFIDEKGKPALELALDTKYDEFMDGLLPFDGMTQGYMDRKGKTVIECNGYRPVGFSDEVGILVGNVDLKTIDKTGKEIGKIDQKYKSVFPMKNDRILVSTSDSKGILYGFLDKDAKEIMPPKYDAVLPVTEDMAVVCKKDVSGKEISYNFGYVDKDGKEVIPVDKNCLFASPFNEGKAIVFNSEKGKWLCIGKDGKEIFELEVK